MQQTIEQDQNLSIFLKDHKPSIIKRWSQKRSFLSGDKIKYQQNKDNKQIIGERLDLVFNELKNRYDIQYFFREYSFETTSINKQKQTVDR